MLDRTDTFSDDCGATEKNCKKQANRISVKAGKTPAYYREIFVSAASGAWRKSGLLAPITLEEDKIEYQLLK